MARRSSLSQRQAIGFFFARRMADLVHIDAVAADALWNDTSQARASLMISSVSWNLADQKGRAPIEAVEKKSRGSVEGDRARGWSLRMVLGEGGDGGQGPAPTAGSGPNWSPASPRQGVSCGFQDAGEAAGGASAGWNRRPRLPDGIVDLLEAVRGRSPSASAASVGMVLGRNGATRT